jgi:hypothetical protein
MINRRNLLKRGASCLPLVSTASVLMLIVDRNVGYHDYKFTEASFENYSYISRRWRDRYLCASVFYLNGSEDKPNHVVATFKELLG